jgi:hypothetical protein
VACNSQRFVLVACFLPGQAKGLSAPGTTVYYISSSGYVKLSNLSDSRPFVPGFSVLNPLHAM